MRLPPGHRLAVEDKPAAADVDALANGLEAYNEGRWPGHQPWRELGAVVRDPEGAVVGGLAGHTYAGWLFVQYLWVSDRLRGAGVGRELLARAERRARERGCHSAPLDTFSFQARGFYEGLGYELFGTLDYPPGHQRHFLRKRLTAGAAGEFGPGGAHARAVDQRDLW
jgi:GNAT superfamily N-acetyltransferase